MVNVFSTTHAKKLCASAALREKKYEGYECEK
jgi:hypothetical protein